MTMPPKTHHRHCRDCGRFCGTSAPTRPRADPTDTEPREYEYRCPKCELEHEDAIARRDAAWVGA